MTLALAIGEWLPWLTGARTLSGLALGLIVISNLRQLDYRYAEKLAQTFAPGTDRIIDIADIIRHRTSANAKVVGYGLDYSGELPYYSERRSFYVPDWFQQASAVWAAPEAFIGDAKPSFVICPSPISPTAEQIARALVSDSRLVEIDKDGCRILLQDALPESPANPNAEVENAK
jgi:hypothetical protein